MARPDRQEIRRLERRLAATPGAFLVLIALLAAWEFAHGDPTEALVRSLLLLALAVGAALAWSSTRQLRRLLDTQERAEREAETREALLAESEAGLRVERRRDEQRRAAQIAAARVLADAGSVAEALPLFLEAVGRELDFLVGLAWLPDGDAFRLGPAWEREPSRTNRLLADWREVSMKPTGEGVVGRVLREGVPVWLEDLRRPSEFIRAQGALEVGVHSGALVPVPVAGQTVAVVEFLAEDVRSRDPDLENVLVAVGIQIGAFVERVRAAEAVREAERGRTEDLERAVAARTQELLRVNRELEAFSYSVSHDLRAPLRAIDGFSQVLEERCAERLDEAGRDHLRRIRQASRRMGQLVDDLLRLSRASGGAVTRADVDVSGMVRELAAELQEHEPDRQVDWEVEAGVRALADPRLLRVALSNLLDNAFKFTRHARKPRIGFGVEAAPWGKAYWVRDNGAGFEPGRADRLFRPFQRLHTLEEFEGTGVGLATVQRIIHRHGGRAWAEGRPGEGACFRFTLGES